MSDDLAVLYHDARRRVRHLAEGLGGQVHAPVPACPGWRVRDVVAHLTAISEDAVAGRLAGPPDEAVTAGQVERLRGVEVPELLDRWEGAAEPFAEIIAAFAVWPAVIDVVTHEHDIRGALDRPGGRDDAAVAACARVLLAFEPPVPLTVRLPLGDVVVGGPGDDRLVLRSTPWEVLRWRMGRRSRRQLAAMAWTGDPAPVLDHLVVFGPAGRDLLE